MRLSIKMLLILMFINTNTVFAQKSDINKDNKNALTFIDAMLVYLHQSNLFDKPYIESLETLYNDKGLITGQTFTSDPTHKRIDKLEIKYGDSGLYIVYGGQKYEFTKLKGTSAIIDRNNNELERIWIESDEKGNIKSITNVETKTRDRKTGRTLEVTYDDQNRLIKVKEYRINMLDETESPKLRSERLTYYLDNDRLKIISRNSGGGETVSIITKTDEFGYLTESANTVTKQGYDTNGNIVYKSYLTDNSGWEKLTEYDGDKLVKEDYRLIKDGKTQERTVTNYLPEGDLKQFYNQDGELYKEEQNFKSRTKVNGEWTKWKY